MPEKKVIFFDYPKIEVKHYIAGISNHDQSSIRFTDFLWTPVFNGFCSKGDDFFWKKLYMHAGIYLQEPGTVLYINEFQQPPLIVTRVR